MKRADRILIGAGCFVLLLISWIISLSSKSTDVKQLELMEQAAELMKDGIFISAVPLLEEAAGYKGANTLAAEEQLKIAYLELINSRGFSNKYILLLEKQMSRKDAHPDIFSEAANYHLEISRIQEALEILRTGIEKTGSSELITIYEDNRYSYELNRTSYEYVAAIHGKTVQVRIDGLWGIAMADGIPVIPCEYEKISTFSAGCAIVLKDGEIYAVDKNNLRIAKLRENATDFGNLADNRISVQISGVWYRAMSDLIPGTMMFEEIGMYSDGYAAAKVNGKWGVIDTASKWMIPPEYDGIIQDELGRCCSRGAVFVRSGGQVYLLVDNNRVGGAYEDARPFSDEGYAAVKRGGLWGYIDLSGNVMVDYLYEDALSFGQHLAAIRQDGLWGYISIYGVVVIEPGFLEAKSFSGGSAPVLTERGWQFITLVEFKKEVSL